MNGLSSAQGLFYYGIISNVNSKPLIWIGLFIGSTIGGAIPALWGDSMLSIWSIFLSTIGGMAGIYAGYKLSQMF